jgi:hypothetical protein
LGLGNYRYLPLIDFYFNVSLGKEKSFPYKLQLKKEDIAKLGISKVKFTPAKFDMGGVKEKWITSSVGSYLITWNFSQIKNFGIVDDYVIKKCPGNIVAQQFRYGKENEIIFSSDHDVFVQKR